jgi:hypothetical protein
MFMCCDCQPSACAYTGQLCNVSQDVAECTLLNVQQAPNEQVDVRLSRVFTDVIKIDEKNKLAILRADVQMWWTDCRYDQLALLSRLSQWGCPNVELAQATMNQTSGFSETWSSSLNAISRDASTTSQFDRCRTQDVDLNLWTPVPPALKMHSGDNHRSKSDGDVYYVNQKQVEVGLWSAQVFDKSKLTFDVSMNYATFPFDEHVLDLTVEFDSAVSAELLQGILMSGGGLAPLDSIQDRTIVTYTASELSPHLSQKAVDSLADLGWHASEAFVEVKKVGNSEELHFYLKVSRKNFIIIMRFFLPLCLLTILPFGGFYLPVTAVMPRTAIGLIPFLTMTVFRNMAYGLIPWKVTYLLWLDPVMISLTELIWLAVVQNIAAQLVNGKRSGQISKFIDKLAQDSFPCILAVLVVLFLILGSTRVDAGVILIVSQLFVVSFTLFLAIRTYMLCRNMRQILMKAVAGSFACAYSRGCEPPVFEPRELGVVFNHIDKDLGGGSGFITVDELIVALKQNGLRFSEGPGVDHEGTLRAVFHSQLSHDEVGFIEFEAKLNAITTGYVTQVREGKRQSFHANCAEDEDTRPEKIGAA